PHRRCRGHRDGHWARGGGDPLVMREGQDPPDGADDCESDHHHNGRRYQLARIVRDRFGDACQVRRRGPRLLGVELEESLGGFAHQLRIVAQVSLDENRRAERGEVIRLERLENIGVEVQLLGRLQDGEAAALTGAAQPRADAFRHGGQPGLRPRSASERASAESGKSSCNRRAYSYASSRSPWARVTFTASSNRSGVSWLAARKASISLRACAYLPWEKSRSATC